MRRAAAHSGSSTTFKIPQAALGADSQLMTGAKAKPPTWITVGELARAFEGKRMEDNTPVPSRDLVGKNLRLHFENGTVVDYSFETSDSLRWSNVSQAKKRQWTQEPYLAARVRDGIYFLDVVRHHERATSFSAVVDINAGIFTAVVGQLPTRIDLRGGLLGRALAGRELTGVKTTFLNGSLNKRFDGARTPRHGTTDELLGKRAEFAFTRTERYEHFYLTDKLYTWHCLAGAEKGLADTDRCHYYKLGDQLYLFVWREKIVPTLGVMVLDFVSMKATGKLFGYKGNDFRTLSNSRCVWGLSLLPASSAL